MGEFLDRQRTAEVVQSGREIFEGIFRMAAKRAVAEEPASNIFAFQLGLVRANP
jgi:hypothetical protein